MQKFILSTLLLSMSLPAIDIGIYKQPSWLMRMGRGTGKLATSTVFFAGTFTAMLAYKKTHDETEKNMPTSNKLKIFFSNWFDKGAELCEAGSLVYADATEKAKDFAAVIGLVTILEKIREKSSEQDKSESNKNKSKLTITTHIPLPPLPTEKQGPLQESLIKLEAQVEDPSTPSSAFDYPANHVSSAMIGTANENIK